MCNQEVSDDYTDEIRTIDQRITVLDDQREQLLQRKQQLLNQSKTQQALTSLSTEQKLTVFKNLFRGRVDIYATRWKNKQGRSGYSVACNNEWVQGVCDKPGIKCNECSNREYKVFNEQTIYCHLAGKHVVGLYPLLTDNTCYLLVADFDKDGWQGAVRAMAQACIQFNIPHTIEVSRSGNGAHLWIFFSDKVPAREARLLGFGLLDKAMEICPDLSFDSYDRLFPNQDIMPEGGFGNLIALPLQKEARLSGNSSFVDQELQPYANQWNHLLLLKTVSKKVLDELIVQLSTDLLRLKEQGVHDNRPPWEQTAREKPLLIENPPESITVTLANHVYFPNPHIESCQHLIRS